MKKTNTLELMGLILIYGVTLFTFTSFMVTIFIYGPNTGQVIVTITSLFVFSVTVFYHAGLIENWKAIALIGFLTTIFGGLFIYVSKSSELRNQKDLTYEEKFEIKTQLETKLEELALLLEKGVLTKSEHDNKRQKLIDQF